MAGSEISYGCAICKGVLPEAEMNHESRTAGGEGLNRNITFSFKGWFCKDVSACQVRREKINSSMKRGPQY
jgi:hypothetical protein